MNDAARAKADMLEQALDDCDAHPDTRLSLMKLALAAFAAEQTAALRDEVAMLRQERADVEAAAKRMHEQIASLRAALIRSRGSYHHEMHTLFGIKSVPENCESTVCQDATRALLAAPEVPETP